MDRLMIGIVAEGSEPNERDERVNNRPERALPADPLGLYHRDRRAAMSVAIGAGPSGMAQVNALVGAAGLDVRCFEMNSEVGGLWTWTDAVGDCHGSMYRYHQTNGLNEFLELEEYSFLEHFGHLITSYPPRAVMLDYLRGWTKKMGGDKCITLNRKVTSVTYDAATKKFTVVSHCTTDDARHIDYFHSVVCCNGHFSVPNWVPPLKGLADFKGRVIHAHSFRDAQDFKGQRLLLIGNGYSGEDIAMQCVKFGAARATIGFRTAAECAGRREGLRCPALTVHYAGRELARTRRRVGWDQCVCMCGRAMVGWGVGGALLDRYGAIWRVPEGVSGASFGRYLTAMVRFGGSRKACLGPRWGATWAV